MKCGECGGRGRYTECDGVGGKWDEKCWQCQGRGTVTVIVEPVRYAREYGDVRVTLASDNGRNWSQETIRISTGECISISYWCCNVFEAGIMFEQQCLPWRVLHAR